MDLPLLLSQSRQKWVVQIRKDRRRQALHKANESLGIFKEFNLPLLYLSSCIQQLTELSPPQLVLKQQVTLLIKRLTQKGCHTIQSETFFQLAYTCCNEASQMAHLALDALEICLANQAVELVGVQQFNIGIMLKCDLPDDQMGTLLGVAQLLISRCNRIANRFVEDRMQLVVTRSLLGKKVNLKRYLKVILAVITSSNNSNRHRNISGMAPILLDALIKQSEEIKVVSTNILVELVKNSKYRMLDLNRSVGFLQCLVECLSGGSPQLRMNCLFLVGSLVSVSDEAATKYVDLGIFDQMLLSFDFKDTQMLKYTIWIITNMIVFPSQAVTALMNHPLLTSILREYQSGFLNIKSSQLRVQVEHSVLSILSNLVELAEAEAALQFVMTQKLASMALNSFENKCPRSRLQITIMLNHVTWLALEAQDPAIIHNLCQQITENQGKCRLQQYYCQTSQEKVTCRNLLNNIDLMLKL